MSRPQTNQVPAPQAGDGAFQTTATTEQAEEPSRPDGPVYYGVMAVSGAIVAVTVILAVWYLVWPGERDASHIKRTILEEDP